MKKFLSLMIISLMILSCFSLTAFAATDIVGTFTASTVDDEGYFTLTGTCDANITTWASAISFDATKVVPVNADGVIETTGLDLLTVNANSAFSLYTNHFINNTHSLYIEAGSSTGTAITAGTEVISIKFKKIANISATDKVFGIAPEEAIDDDNGIYQYEDSGNGFKAFVKDQGESTIADGNATLSFNIDNLVTSKPDPEDWKDTVKDTTTGDIKFPETSDKIGTDNDADLKADAEVKKVVIFAKAVDALTGTKDGSANYGITIGGMYYPGYLSVPAGSNWSIILVDPNNTLTNSYSASVTVNGETKTLENVSFK